MPFLYQRLILGLIANKQLFRFDRFILFSEDLSQNLYREIFIAAAKSRNRCIGCVTEKRNIMLPLYSRVYLVMHRWEICPGPTQIRSRTLSFLSSDLRTILTWWTQIDGAAYITVEEISIVKCIFRQRYNASIEVQLNHKVN